jgi:hypothetical protein
MYQGKTTDQLRAEREATEEIKERAARLAHAIVEQYPDEGLELELSELDDLMGIRDATERRMDVLNWLAEHEEAARDEIAPGDEDGFLGAFEDSFKEAME